jgi:hypothetical protein
MISRVKIARLGLLVAVCSSPALAQEGRFADDPTVGLTLPGAPLAGEADATSTVTNPASLTFLGGTHLALAVTGHALGGVTAGGTGIGGYLAAPLAVPFLPRLGFGVALEKLYPPRDVLAPDPGQPLRLTFAAAWAMGRWLSAGVSYRSFHGEGVGSLDGVSTWDAGLAARLDRHLALGVVVHDLIPPLVEGAPLERRYDAEVVVRPTGTDRLELGLAAAIGERRNAIDRETARRGDNSFIVSISDEVEGEKWLVKTDKRCNILKVSLL